MFFRFSPNRLFSATGAMAKGLFVIGLLLMGFGLLVFVLRDIFALIAAAIFIASGLALCISAARLMLNNWRMRKAMRGPGDPYRENVNVRDPHGPL